jgi:hypothetical protein
MNFRTRPHFEDRQIVQYLDESVTLSGITNIAPIVLNFSGTTTAETAVTISELTGYLNGGKLSGFVVKPPTLLQSGTTATTTTNVENFVLKSLDQYGSVGWAPISGISWSVSACTSPLNVTNIVPCTPGGTIYFNAGNLEINNTVRINDGSQVNGYVFTSDVSGNGSWQILPGTSSASCINDFYVSNIHSCSPLNINPLDEGNIYFGSTSGVTIDIINSRIGVNNTNPSSNLHISGTTYFDTIGLTNSGVPSFRFLDGVSTPTETTAIKSIYKEFRPTTTSSNTVITDGTIIYPNVNSPTSAEFYASGNLNLFTGNLNNLTSIEALTAEVNVIQIQTNTGTYSGFVKSSSSVLRNLTNGGVVDKYVGFWMNGFDIDFTHNGTTNNMYGFYMDSQSGRSGNIPPISNRWGVYIDDNGRNYFAGNVGIGTNSPSEKLDVSGKTKTSQLQVTTSPTSGYVLTSDVSGNATWQPSSAFTGNTSASCITDLYVTNIHGCSPITIWDSVQTLGSLATGTTSFALGIGNLANGIASFAEGGNTTANGPASHAEGSGTLADGDASHAEGYQTIALGDYSHVEGYQTLASGNFGSHAEGFLTIASGTTSHSEGRSTVAGGSNSHAEGNSTKAYGNDSHSEGSNTIANGTGSHAEGGTTIAIGNYSHAEGEETISIGLRSHTEGYITSATTTNAHAEGFQTLASGGSSHAEGSGTVASGDNSHAEGDSTIASGTTSHAEGGFTTAIGQYSHAEGYVSSAVGDYSHAEGLQTLASGNSSHSEGYDTVSIGDYSHAEGELSTTYGSHSHAEGTSITYGSFSHSQNYNTRTYGTNSHAGGDNSIASGNTSFIHSTNSLVTGNRSVVLGGQNITGTTDDTVYIPYLNISNLAVGSPVNNLGIDSNGNVVVGTSGSGSTGNVTIDPYFNVGSASTLTWDVSGTSTNYEITLTANTALNLTNVRNGDYGSLILNQDSVGSRSMTLGTVNGSSITHLVVNGGGGLVSLTTNPNAVDLLSFTYNGSKMFWTVGNDYT